MIRVPSDYNLTSVLREREAASTPRAVRERELVERALSGSPDYAAALRRAAIANVDEESAGQQRRSPRAREQAISAEEARLSDAVERRRRQRLADDQRLQAQSRVELAVAQCNSQAAQIEASMFNPRSFLNLEAAAAAAQFRNSCIANAQRLGGI